MSAAILAINAGSSSIKFALFEPVKHGQLRELSRGVLEGIGTSPHLLVHSKSGDLLAERRWTDASATHEDLIGTLFQEVDENLDGRRLIAVGHRVVHGGTRFTEPTPLNPSVISALDELTPLAPLHQPHSLFPVRAIAAARPGLLQVGCFDTAFHRTLSPVAARFALPHRFADKGVRRYGFHGLSYEYVAGRLRKVAPHLMDHRVVVAHLGNGASLCGLHAGKSVDTSMGFSALDGLVMGTRCGAIDPGVILYLEAACGLSVREIEHLLYFESGLLGASGLSSDMRALLASRDLRACEAIELFVFRLTREIGAIVSTLGGLDGLVFTAGIGEHAAAVRAAACVRLAWLGIEIDEDANAASASHISTRRSPVEVRIIPTDEEAMIAMHALDVTLAATRLT